MTLKMLLALCCAFAPFASRTCGQGILLHGPTDFIESTRLIDFETFPNGQSAGPYSFPIISSQWANLGVRISDSTPEDGAALFYSTGEEIPTYSGTNGVAPSFAGRGGFLIFNFLVPTSGINGTVTEVGLWTINGAAFGGAPSTVTFLDAAGAPIRSVDATIPYSFVGLRYDAGISGVRISDPDYFLTDNLQFGPVTPIPEPSAWALLVAGAFVCATLRRRLEK